MRSKRFFTIALVGALFAGCGGGELLAPGAASVNGDKITTDQVSEAREDFEETKAFDQLSQQNGKSEARRLFEQGFLGQLIRRKVLRPQAEKLGVEVEDSEVEARLDQIKKDFPSEEEFDKAVADQGLTEQQLFELVRDQVIEGKLREEVTADAVPDDAELEAYYDQHEDDYAETRASHILVKEKGLAQRLAGQLKDVPARHLDREFASLAKKHSDDKTSGAKGGDLGYASPNSYVPEFSKALAALEIDQISDPVKSEFGFHLIRVTGRRTQTFDQVKADILQQLAGEEQEKAWQEWLMDAYKEADVEVNSRFGELDLATQQVVDAEPGDRPGVGQEPAGESGEPSPQS